MHAYVMLALLCLPSSLSHFASYVSPHASLSCTLYVPATCVLIGPGGREYPREVALGHYRLAVVDYARFMVSRFWGDASPQAVAKKKDSPNTTLPNRLGDGNAVTIG